MNVLHFRCEEVLPAEVILHLKNSQSTRAVNNVKYSRMHLNSSLKVNSDFPDIWKS